MRKIHSFHDYIREQEEKKGEEKKGEEKKGEAKGAEGLLGGLDAAGMASAMMSAAFKKLGFEDKDYSRIDDTEETKASKPYMSCGNTPYTFSPIEATNQEIIDLFKDPSGKFAKDVRYADISKEINANSQKLFILGVREELDVKKREGDKFIDKIAIIDPSKPGEKVISYQATTTPSVEYYSDPKRALNSNGVAIMQPGVAPYKVGIHKKGSPTQHEALVQDGEMEINRFELSNSKLETYEPGKPDKDDSYGINIHRSSTERGVCVGPYSAGCQVFADGKEFQDFMNRLKASSVNGGKFLYVLVQNDDFGSGSSGSADLGDSKEETSTVVDKTDEFKDAGASIRAELDKYNSSEDALIQTYNSVVTSQEDASKFAKVYMEEYNVDIISDLDRALSGKELDQLKFK